MPTSDQPVIKCLYIYVPTISSFTYG